MSLHSQTHDLFIKNDDPEGASLYQDDSDLAKTKLESLENISSPKISSLGGLDDETVHDLLDIKNHTLSDISRGFTEDVITPGIYNEDGQTYAVCPKSFFRSDNIIGAMIYDLCNFANITIKPIEYKANITKVYDEKFVQGLWFGTFSSISLKRRRGKKAYELGRACTFALLIKSVFADTEQLGSAALVKDHFFFGNNPGEMTKNKNIVPFYVKMKLRSFFENPELGDLVLGILNRTVSAVGVSYLSESEADKMISENLIPIDQLITQCYPTITTGKGRKISEKTKKPNPIRNSPLYLREEMELITQLTSPLFSELDAITSNYEQSVFTRGFVPLKEHIRNVINLRWETLQRFANRTKLRLQDIRRITGDGSKKKANVTPSDVTALLTNLPDAPMRLVREIKHILGNNNILLLYSQVFKEEPLIELDAWALVHKRAFDIYKNIQNANFKISSPNVDNIQVRDLTTEYTKVYNTLGRLQHSNGELIKNMSLVSRTKYFKLYGRFKQIEVLIKSCGNLIENLKQTHIDVVNMAIDIYYEGLYKDRAELLSNYSTVFEKEMNNLQNRLITSLKFETNEASIEALKSFLQKIENFKESWNSRLLNT